MELPLSPLRVFHLTALRGSVSRAAEELRVTQPAVTQQIRRLERSVGLQLFRRDGRRIVLTEAGTLLAGFTEKIFRLVDAAQDALEGAAGLRVGQFSVGASRTAGAYYVAGLLGRFRRRYPGIRLTLSVANSQTILARVSDFSLHAGVVAPPMEMAVSQEIVARPLVRDPLLVMLPLAHPLARRATITARDLRAQPLILREPGSTTRRMVEGALGARGVPVQAVMELEDNEAIKTAVADGLGIAVMARSASAPDVAAGRLIGRTLRGVPALEFALIYHRDRLRSPVLTAFLALLDEPKRARKR